MSETCETVIREAADLVRRFASNPPPQHWLDTDAGPSYCWPCARKARWNQLPSIGPVPDEVDFYNRDPIERLIRDGIDGGDWYSGTSDSPQHCDGCGCILRFHLTASGAAYTLEGFEADTIDATIFKNADACYELAEMFDADGEVGEPEILRAIEDTARAVLTLECPSPTPDSGDNRDGE